MANRVAQVHSNQLTPLLRWGLAEAGHVRSFQFNDQVWYNILANFLVNIFEVECIDMTAESKLQCMRLLLTHGSFALIRPIAKDGEVLLNVLPVFYTENGIRNLDNSIEQINVVYPPQVRKNKFAWQVTYNSDEFVLVNFGIQDLHLQANELVKLYSNKVMEIDLALQQNMERLKQPIIMKLRNTSVKNISSLFRESIKSLNGVFAIGESNLIENTVGVHNQLFEDIDRSHDSDVIFRLQQDIVNDFAKMLGFNVIERDNATYIAEQIQLTNLDFNSFKRHSYLKNLNRYLHQCPEKLGVEVKIRESYF